mgnify:CR=1 FL=1
MLPVAGDDPHGLAGLLPVQGALEVGDVLLELFDGVPDLAQVGVVPCQIAGADAVALDAPVQHLGFSLQVELEPVPFGCELCLDCCACFHVVSSLPVVEGVGRLAALCLGSGLLALLRRLLLEPLEPSLDGVHVGVDDLHAGHRIVAAVERLVAVVAGQFLPRPAVAAAGVFEHQLLREQAVEVVEIIACVGVAVEVAIPRPGLLHLEARHDGRLAGVDAEGVEPAGDLLVVADRHLRGR